LNKYKLKTEKTQRSFLTDEELKLIEDFQTTKPILELHKDMFIFAAYAGGLRISDILQLKWKHLDGKHISFTMKKTNLN